MRFLFLQKPEMRDRENRNSFGSRHKIFLEKLYNLFGT